MIAEHPWRSLMWLSLMVVGCISLVSATSWALKRLYRNAHILEERRWPEDFWRHSWTSRHRRHLQDDRRQPRT